MPMITTAQTAEAGDEGTLREALNRSGIFGEGGQGKLTIRDLAYTAFMRAKGKNDEDGGPTDWFNDTLPLVQQGIEKLRGYVDAAALASSPAARAPAAPGLPEELRRAREQAADAEATLAAWFDVKARADTDLGPAFKGAIGGFLRTSRCGGMPAELSDQIETVLNRFIDLQGGLILAPVIAAIVKERTLAAAPAAPPAGITVERVGKGVMVTFAESEYDSEAHRYEEPLPGMVVVLDVDGSILRVEIEDLSVNMVPDPPADGAEDDALRREVYEQGREIDAINEAAYLEVMRDDDASSAPADGGTAMPLRDVVITGPVNGMGEPDPAGSYFRLVLTKGDVREERKLSRGALETLSAEIAGLLDKSTPAGAAGDLAGADETTFLRKVASLNVNVWTRDEIIDLHKKALATRPASPAPTASVGGEPVAWGYDFLIDPPKGEWAFRVLNHRPVETLGRRNIRPLYEAALAPAAQVNPGRAEIARIINPVAFRLGSPDYYGPDLTEGMYSAAQRDALAKADAILAARPVAAGDAGWRPIETLPFGRQVLLGGWTKGFWLTTVFEATDENWRENFDWIEDEPTHWMLVPAPAIASTTQSVGGTV